ncbi:NAD(P)-dependent oxidoreductase [Anaerocolumna xylanovorans]|uniref:D-lactate dehydrogenase n=1 Tax=Anaerocolumna xylanovorans DSM 12503 TaxID=1121345 RepID=A0A1M7Y7W0_9FIRM|nr:NAD(P)-dependent oxidoreductase [Anaerocolumna xylanovorans]SHO48714.1 D-lactate dehydrogenase [Anaerocolumna xylanovorans DSM 12503]
MKIYVYDVTDFEKSILEALQKEFTDEIVLTDKHLTLETLEEAEEFDGISVHGYSKVNREVLIKMKEYGIVHLSTRTIGYDHFDMAAVKELGIHAYHAYYSPNNVADFTVMMMLIMLRKAKISICRALVNDFSLEGMMGREMRSLTVGVIGTGKIGSAVIKSLSGFGCKIIAYDKFKNPIVKEFAEYVDLDTLYAQSDIITLHTPLTEDNYHMINEETIQKMKKGVILINTARGQLIDTESLIKALEEEHVGGAGIDTLEEETGVMHVHVGTKIVDKRSLLYLKQFPNVLYTQHYAFYTQEATESMVRCGITSIQSGVRGEATLCEISVNY